LELILALAQERLSRSRAETALAEELIADCRAAGGQDGK
jgi:hypothetical protein